MKIHTDQFKTLTEAPELAALDQLADEFATAMKQKLHQKYREGWHGWDEAENEEALKETLYQHAGELLLSDSMYGSDDLVDIANFAAMIWNMTVPQEL